MLVPVIDGKEVNDETLAMIGRIIGGRIAHMASQRGWTQSQVAQNMQPSRSKGTVSMLMRGGIVDPPITTLIAMAKLFNVSLDQLVGFTPLPEVETPSSPSDVPDISQETLRQELLETNKRQMAGIEQVQQMQSTLAQIQEALEKAGLLGAQSKPRTKRKAG